MATLASDQLYGRSSAPCHLRALARLELDAVNNATNRDITHRQGVTGTYRCRVAGLQYIASLNTLGCDNVAALAVCVHHQCDVRGTVRVVLQALYCRRDIVLVPLEIDNAVVLLVSTTNVSGGYPAVIVTATGFALLLQQGLVGSSLVQIRIGNFYLVTPASRGRFTLYYSHL